MRKLVLCLAIASGLYLPSTAQQAPLRFDAAGKFKIVQFTDLHYIHGDPRSDAAIERINEVLDAEKPNLVMLTGDVIFGKPAEEGLRYVLSLISDRKIPFAVMFGNHDDEHGLSREQLFDIIRPAPYNLTGTVEGLSGVTNFTLPVKAGDGNKDAAILYGFDSNAYSQLEGVKGYDYIKFDQVNWYRETSAEYTRLNGGSPLPSLAFFHIPLPEYNQAAADENTQLYGIRREKACAPELNTGMFASMRERGDVMATFVGHDHDNDYVAYWKGILLAYGRYTGGNTVYNNIPNGARVIELTEGKRSFKTWIHQKMNVITQQVSYPEDFIKK